MCGKPPVNTVNTRRLRQAPHRRSTVALYCHKVPKIGKQAPDSESCSLACLVHASCPDGQELEGEG